MVSWKETYENGFKIISSEPSKVIKLGLNYIPKNSFVLDLGSGGGRNSVFMAQLGNSVDSVDIVNLRFLDKLPNNLNKLIRFHHESVDNFVIEKDKYNMIILARLIQYLDDNSLRSLIKRCSSGLKNKGVILISYSLIGGIKERFGVEFY